jgi:hypothetical protein
MGDKQIPLGIPPIQKCRVQIAPHSSAVNNPYVVAFPHPHVKPVYSADALSCCIAAEEEEKK